MMIRFISVSFIITLLSACATLAPQKGSGVNPNDIVRWADTTKLNWNDFQGQPIKESPVGSEIYIQYNAFFQKPTMFLPSTTTVEFYVEKKASWVLKSKAKPLLLFYNQTLFDLYELYARKLRKKLSDTNFGIADPAGIFNSIYQENSHELAEISAQYRSETGMGVNNKKINEWSDRISKELKDLAEYRTK